MFDFVKKSEYAELCAAVSSLSDALAAVIDVSRRSEELRAGEAQRLKELENRVELLAGESEKSEAAQRAASLEKQWDNFWLYNGKAQDGEKA